MSITTNPMQLISADRGWWIRVRDEEDPSRCRELQVIAWALCEEVNDKDGDGGALTFPDRYSPEERNVPVRLIEPVFVDPDICEHPVTLDQAKRWSMGGWDYLAAETFFAGVD